MSTLRIVVANEPRSYRDSLAVALRCLRAELEIMTAEPADLSAEIARLLPQLVICSWLTSAVEDQVGAWIVLPADRAAPAVISVDGERRVLAEAHLQDLVAVADQLARPQTQP